jgi:hypothetical protein
MQIWHLADIFMAEESFIQKLYRQSQYTLTVFWSCEENVNRHFMFINNPKISAICDIMWKNMAEPDRPQATIQGHYKRNRHFERYQNRQRSGHSICVVAYRKDENLFPGILSWSQHHVSALDITTAVASVDRICSGLFGQNQTVGLISVVWRKAYTQNTCNFVI